MGWNGSGTVTLLYDFTTDRDAGAPTYYISADKVDAMFEHVEALIKKGALIREANKARSLTPSPDLELPGDDEEITTRQINAEVVSSLSFPLSPSTVCVVCVRVRACVCVCSV
jgi:hypothetical protein